MVARRHCARERQQGSVLVAVMVFMALLMLFATTLINHLLVSEAEEVESLLAETRVYWAMNGHLNYMLSRAAAQGLCTSGSKGADLAANQADACSDDNDGNSTDHLSFTGRTTHSRVGSLQDYLDGTDELQQSGSINNPGALIWYFPQNANANGAALNAANVTNSANKYHFSISGVVEERERSGGAAADSDGQLRIDFYVTDVGDAPVLRNISDRVGRLTVGFCALDQEGGSTSPTDTGDTSTCISDPTPPSHTEGTSRIQFIQRNLPFTFSTN